MQLMTSNLEFKLNVNLRLVKPDFMQSTAVNLEFKLKVIFKLFVMQSAIYVSSSISLTCSLRCIITAYFIHHSLDNKRNFERKIVNIFVLIRLNL